MGSKVLAMLKEGQSILDTEKANKLLEFVEENRIGVNDIREVIDWLEASATISSMKSLIEQKLREFEKVVFGTNKYEKFVDMQRQLEIDRSKTKPTLTYSSNQRDGRL